MITTAVVLAGGKGTRLRPLTLTMPKPLVPVGNIPILDHILALLQMYGFEKVIIAVNYLGEMIRSHILTNIDKYDMEILVPRIRPLDTADAVRKLRKFIDNDFLVVMGDVLTNMNLRQFAEYHEKKGGMATIALIEVPSLLDFGAIIMGENGKIIHFIEKPNTPEIYIISLAYTRIPRGLSKFYSNLANTGFYALSYKILDILDDNPYLMDWGRHVFPWLLENDYEIYGWDAGEAYWTDVGRPFNYLNANFDLLSGEISPLKPYGEEKDGIWLGRNIEIDENVVIHPPCALGDNVIIEKNTIIGPYSIIGHNVYVGEGSNIERSIVMDNTRIESFVNVTYSILAKNILIRKNAIIKGFSVIGEGVTVESKYIVKPNTVLQPHSYVAPVNAGEKR
ncbi:MAG: NDP-sugar synthase [Thermoprotei archaeon]|nr:MAG: NDP-sugar synthase [Thermoprotei archaeon]